MWLHMGSLHGFKWPQSTIPSSSCVHMRIRKAHAVLTCLAWFQKVGHERFRYKPESQTRNSMSFFTGMTYSRKINRSYMNSNVPLWSTNSLPWNGPKGIPESIEWQRSWESGQSFRLLGFALLAVAELTMMMGWLVLVHSSLRLAASPPLDYRRLGWAHDIFLFDLFLLCRLIWSMLEKPDIGRTCSYKIDRFITRLNVHSVTSTVDDGIVKYLYSYV